MSLIEFIILSIALSFEILIVMHGCSLKTKISLTKGLAESATIAVIHTLLLAIGMVMGGLLHFQSPDANPDSSTSHLWSETNNLVYLGLMILVALRLLFRSGKKSRQVQPYDISRFSTTLLLGVATGINTLIVGLALGFRISFVENVWRATIPLAITMTLFAFLGVMLGRQQKELRARRYTLFAVLFLLAFAFKGAFWG
ncbi:MAG: manganese efflux pump [Bacteroidales bacterium]|nr:manganese efflux pump [Bacteroidales bacterium]